MMRAISTVLGLAIVVIIAGCVSFGESRPTEYYLLNSDAGQQSSASDSDVVLLVGPVDLPSYLNRPQIVARDGNQLKMGAFDRWSEPLGENVTRVMTENLAGQLGIRNVYPFEANRLVPADKQIAVQFYQFDGSVGKNVTIDARWQIVSATGEPLTTSIHFKKNIEAGDGYSGYVSALNQGLQLFSESIAKEVKELL